MRGKELDTLIEHELQLMLVEGFDKSPISAKALHIRLKAKGIVNGGLSTLSSLERKRLIAAYVDQQPIESTPKRKTAIRQPQTSGLAGQKPAVAGGSQ
jgi:hypothetical protein